MPKPMFLFRAVLPLVVSLSLLACATPLRAAPSLSLNSQRPPQQVADCLQQGLQKLHIPDDFVERRDERDGSRSLALRNPVSDASGTRVDILPQGEGSLLEVRLNGMPLSPAWKKQIHGCARK
ncbi:Uncharacterized protein ChrSV_5072 [Chromobacterium vaccinii]|nr:hypothetical protein CFN79_06895 [Chromobacterium vaccinii]QND87290.1 Uncharacterized protein ChrSW_5066 [Chromobacterium vaccinii]QND92527.1 Uncharacterized protein ChrSV_5072 [Chromobacterium vaccinii]SUX29243.1 Uncharacterised protein [Chromobacterium vaccinii]